MMTLFAAEVHQASPGWVMALFGLGMLLTYVGVAYERFHKTVAALLGAGLLTLLGLELHVFEYPEIYEFIKKNLDVFGVIIGTGILVGVTGQSGLFHFLGMLIVRATGGRASLLFFSICWLTFAFVTVLTIVPATLILCSLVMVICRSLDYSPKPFLLAVAICANSGAIVTFASGLPNIMIGTAAGIPYAQFLMVSAPFAVFSLLLALIVLRVRFRHELPWRQTPDEKQALAARMAEFDPWALVEDRWVLVRNAAILVATVLGFAFAQLLGLGMDFIAMSGGTAALLFAGKRVEDTIAKVNWTVILFFMGLFLIIGCVEATGALDWLAERVVDLSQNNVTALVALLSGFAAVSSAVVDNIPVAATMIPIVHNISALGLPPEPLWWSLVLACNLGGNGTPIGSISCVIALYTLKKEANVEVGWGEFIKLGGTILLLQVAATIAYLEGLYAFDLLPKL
jgi:Na+/H+ antiporter NhaD/arsenite permease-like protein